ncbi:hypothetical protein AJ79_04062 [Helicocarpus griseus UAMH5409]|uniref:Wax synthase domain-containing protein n=1 Tax=Helicocarpus griseus UAMH5409 TaxID=1447875 RepID=A0A2B7XWB0_9EURO|nr:hypothetical protein AJ79_04062 [Helicocarpus griseus UAMH5409]
MFGGMGDAYTLRGFWGKFWHQLLRWSYTSVSNHFTRRILRLRHPSLIERYANILTIFILSGLGHVLVFAGSGIPMAEWSGSMLFFCSFAAGFMTEDGVQELWRRTGIEKRLFADGRNARGLSLFKRIVGWVWVLGFLSVVSPFFCYPMSRVPTGKEGMVPYSVVERVGVEGALGTVVAGGVGLWFGLEARGV